MFRSPLFPIFLTVLVDVLGLTIVLPLLPYYARHFGASPFVVTTLAASYAVCTLVSGPILGRISDRVGRKPTLLASQLGTFVGFLIIANASSLSMLFLGRIIDGLTAGNLSIAQAYVSDVTRPENRTRAFALVGIAFGTGFLIGPFISGALAHHVSYAAPALFAAGLSALSIVTTATLLPRTAPRPSELPGTTGATGATGTTATAATTGTTARAPAASPSRTRSAGELFRRPEARRRLLEFFAFMLSFSTLVGGLALFLQARFDFTVDETGYIFGVSGLVGAVVQGGLIGRLVRRFGDARLATIGLGAMAVAYACLGFAYVVPVLVGLTVVGAFGTAVTRPALTTLITKSVGPDEQGMALGVSQSLASLAQIVANLGAGALIERGWLAAWGLVGAFYASVGLLIGWRGRRAAP
ncbi:MAG: MFS transporter, partial [Polyangiaceae bacterium]|nr:MFS transporter [Polyangiaceae bacterium]